MAGTKVSVKKKETKEFNKERFIENVKSTVRKRYRADIGEATQQQIFQAVSEVVEDEIIEKWMDSYSKFLKQQSKTVYYLSMEFLLGRALDNNTLNLGAYDYVKEALDELGVNINALEDEEPDPALGNGGLGRLAACFMDSLASLGYHAYGCGIRYHYGMFKQKIENGFQTEEADNWTKYGDAWSVRHDEDAVEINYSDQKVLAVPYDIPIIGYGAKNIGMS